MSSPRLLAYASPLVLDACAAGLVLGERGALGAGAHALAVAVAFGMTRRLLGAGSTLGAPASAALLVLALPLVGPAVLAFVAGPSWSRRLQSPARAVLEVALPDGSATIDAPSAELVPGGRSIRELLRQADSAEERVRAVMALRHLEAQRAVPLLRLAFSNDSEDVRLLAFGILEQREKRLRHRIEQNAGRLASAQGGASAARARGHALLARDHWELVYCGFASGDIEPVVLGLAREHAEAALALAPDARTAALLARIHLRRREPELAWSRLEQARGAGLPPASAAPLFAEAAFQMRRFGEIPAILRGAGRAGLRRPELEPVAEYWTGQA